MMKLCECIQMCQQNYHNGSWIHTPPTTACYDRSRDPLLANSPKPRNFKAEPSSIYKLLLLSTLARLKSDGSLDSTNSTLKQYSVHARH